MAAGAAVERRLHSRRRPGSGKAAELRLAGGRVVACRLVDLGLGGARLEIAEGEAPVDDWSLDADVGFMIDFGREAGCAFGRATGKARVTGTVRADGVARVVSLYFLTMEPLGVRRMLMALALAPSFVA